MYQFHQEQHFYALKLAQEGVLKDPRNSWVMTSPNEQGFVKLPNERILYTSPPRVSLQLSPPVAGAEPYSIKSDTGVAYITNQRVNNLPSASAEHPLMVVNPAADCLPTRESHSRIEILLCAYLQSPRFIRASSIFRRKLLGRIMSTGVWRGHSTIATCGRVTIDISRWRGL